MTNNKLTGVEHNLKIAPEYFAAVVAGVKHAEMRFNDRNYQTGDVLNLCEWDDGTFTGAFVSADVTHVCELPSVPGYALLSFELQERRKADSENLVKDRQRVIDGLCSVGETVWGIEEYMKKWDARYLPKTSSPAPLQGSQPVSNRDELREQVRREHAEWSDKTFGDVGPVGPLKHLSKEALEASADPSDPLEWADMQFLLWDAQRRMGISDEFITRAMIEKLEINKSRQWPEPKDDEPRLHIKEQPAPVVPEE
ncbi:DUF550 domain-containing protein [Salmonella enterica]|nr:DUF550 domain-containing protein [Salmonella enterica]